MLMMGPSSIPKVLALIEYSIAYFHNSKLKWKPKEAAHLAAKAGQPHSRALGGLSDLECIVNCPNSLAIVRYLNSLAVARFLSQILKQRRTVTCLPTRCQFFSLCVMRC